MPRGRSNKHLKDKIRSLEIANNRTFECLLSVKENENEWKKDYLRLSKEYTASLKDYTAHLEEHRKLSFEHGSLQRRLLCGQMAVCTLVTYIKQNR